MKLLEFIKSNPLWKDELEKVNIKIVIEGDLALFKYDHILTDFNHELAEYCRGSIIDIKNMKYVCKAFNKFWNHGDRKCAKLDEKSIKFQEKLDGSIIKVWYYNDKWNVSTNGTIYAENATLSEFSSEIYNINNFRELFDRAWDNESYSFEWMDKNNTYIFELCTPCNKVVVPHEDFNLYIIGMFDNTTTNELNKDARFRTCKEYHISSIEQAIEISKILPYDNEGYVAVDKYGNRCKIKSLAYVSVHRLFENGKVRLESLYNIINLGEQEEVLTYFPEFKERIELLEKRMNEFRDSLIESCNKLSNAYFDNRKDYAIFINKEFICPSYGFLFLDKKIGMDYIKDLYRNVDYKKVEKYIK